MTEYVLRPPTGGANYHVDYAHELNPQQLEVVMAGDGPMLVIAGAGSGKTRTLTYRVSRLIESGVPPTSILLLTFTNKAAREMLRRVEALTHIDMRLITGGTFHHVGNLVLRRHAKLVDYRSNFNIIDREDAKDLMDDITAKHKSGDKHMKFPKGDVLLEILSFAINTDQPPMSVLKDQYPVFHEMQDDVIRAFNAYAARKRDLNLMDFDDLLVFWRRIVTKLEAVREELHQRWKYILVDEYQDTNRLQSEIVETISGPTGNVMVVGDDAQSIYSFRGANFGNIIDFPKRFPTAKHYKLEINYRSVPQVLDLANSSIRHNKRQFPKTLQAVRPAGPKPESVVCGDVFEQARFVAQRIGDLRDEGFDLRDIAVLYRAHWHSMELQIELTQLGIPFEVRSGVRFFEQAHIKDVASYLKVIANPRDEIAWKRIMRLYPKIGKATAAKIWAAMERIDDPVAKVRSESIMAAVPKSAHGGWRELAAILETIQDQTKSPAQMIRSVLNGGYETYLTTTFANFGARIEDVKRLADYSMRYSEVEQLLSELALTSGVTGQDAMEEDPDQDRLILSTVHQAKGLEWRAVFVIWVAEGRIPDARAVLEPDGEEEERRLFYVACTRAKDQLYLVYPTIADERQYMGVIQRPSRFLRELDRDTYEESHAGYGR